MIRRLGYAFARFAKATTPDPFVLAVALTLVVFGLAFVLEGKGPIEIANAWQGDTGFFGLLAFTMQMVLILVTGHALAAAPPVASIIRRVAGLPRTGAQAATLVAVAAMTMALFNWGLGLIVGALLAREVGRSCEARGVNAHYPLLAAAGYTGLLVWHGGISGTAPLMMTAESNVTKFLGPELSAAVGTLPLTETVFGTMNLVATLGVVVLVAVLVGLLAPKAGDHVDPIGTIHVERPIAKHREPRALSGPERLERSPLAMALIALPLMFSVMLYLKENGITRLDPNALNLIFLTVGLLLHGSFRHYLDAVEEAVKGSAGIVIQFPFYAGIMGVMRETGLAARLAASFSAVDSGKLYSVLTFGSAAVINLFVPSGGGQWAVQGPVAMTAGQALGVPPAITVMAVAYGDQLTNMLQPFWALPLLAITGVKARDIVGYTAFLMIAAGLYIGVVLYTLTP